MRESNKDKARGATRELKGKFKEASGVLTDNPRRRSEGRTEKVAGKVQKKAGQIKRVLED